MSHDGFKIGSGCYACESCGKQTRSVDSSYPYCAPCRDRLEHENSHADNSFPNDDCGDEDCPIKHYTPEQRWWA